MTRASPEEKTVASVYALADQKRLLLTGKVGCDEEEGSAKKGEGDSHSPFRLDLRDDPGRDCGVLHLCVGQHNK